VKPVTANPRWDWRNPERGFFTLIGLLIVIVIIGIMLAMYAGPPGGVGPAGEGAGGASTVPGAAIGRAKDTVCRNNLAQLRAALASYLATDGSYPRSLAELQPGVPTVCPVADEPYQYDPSSGQAYCVHAGHEDF
jgi:hypothetical protein